MARVHFFLAAGLVVLGSIAFAHSGVTNAAVMQRMEAMKATQASTKIVGEMVKGERVFDVLAARGAALDISRHAAETPELFREQETDPKSEALPLIWEEFDDFAKRSFELEVLAKNLAETVKTEDQLRAAFTEIGTACKSCHQKYRE